MVEVVGEGVEVVDYKHLDGDRELGWEGFFRSSISFGGGCGCRLSRFRDRLRHNLSKKNASDEVGSSGGGG